MLSLGQEYTLEFSYTQEDVETFAKISGDDNPIHLDADYASKTVFKKRIIHGVLSISIFSKILGTKFPGEGTIFMKLDAQFKRPMYVDQKYKARVWVKELNERRHQAVIATEIIDPETNKQTITGEALIMHNELI